MTNADQQDFIPALSLTQRERDCLLLADMAPEPYGEPPIEPLTDLQCRILTLAAQGYGNREIAESLCYARRYVRNVLTDAYQRLGIAGGAAHKRSHAVYLAWQQGAIDLPEPRSRVG